MLVKVAPEGYRQIGQCKNYDPETCCFLGFKVAVESWSDYEDLDGIIGPTCSTVCLNIGLVAAAWNIPMVSPTCQVETLSDKDIYPTFTRPVGPFTTHSVVIDATIEFFG